MTHLDLTRELERRIVRLERIAILTNRLQSGGWLPKPMTEDQQELDRLYDGIKQDQKL